MPDSVVTSRHTSIRAWKILAVIVVFTTMIAAIFYWATRLNETEQMLVGDWVLVSKDGSFIKTDKTTCFRFSPDGEFDVFDLEDRETSPGEPFGSWSANRMAIKLELGEWGMLEFLRYRSGNPFRFEMPILKLTDTELIFERNDYEGPMKLRKLTE